MSTASGTLRTFKSILKSRDKKGYYRTLFYRGFPGTFFGRILTSYFAISKRLLSHVILPLGVRKKVIIPSDRQVKDFDEALVYVYFDSMYRLVKMQIPKDIVCVDVGAHYGFWTLRMADKCKLVIALEPAPNNFAILYNSLMHSKVKNVIALPFAAGETSRRSFIVKPQSGTDEMYYIDDNIASVRNAYPVRVIALDNLLDHLLIERVNLIKIDVEGFELYVLDGLRERLSKGLVDLLILEVHSPLLLDRCLKMLRKYNYDIKFAFKIARGLYEVYAIKKNAIIRIFA
jgi:FkbM family methyltransferase